MVRRGPVCVPSVPPCRCRVRIRMSNPLNSRMNNRLNHRLVHRMRNRMNNRKNHRNYHRMNNGMTNGMSNLMNNRMAIRWDNQKSDKIHNIMNHQTKDRSSWSPKNHQSLCNRAKSITEFALDSKYFGPEHVRMFS